MIQGIGLRQNNEPLPKLYQMKTSSLISLFVLSLLLFFSKNSFAQTTISGNLVDVNGTLPFANVLLLHTADSSLVRGTITEEDGSFLLKNVAGG